MAIDPQQQRIIGYFIEEAKEHLETIYKGLQDFSQTVKDKEAIHEMYRAAHSIKGGAAMLGVEPVRFLAYYLEDFFKVIKENQHLVPDRQLVDLFLEGYAYLPQLLKKLETNFEIPPEMSKAAIESGTITMDKLGAHLHELLQAPEPSEVSLSPIEQFASVVQAALSELHTHLAYPRTEEGVESLLRICDELYQWGEYLQVEKWMGLITSVREVINNPFNSFEILATVLPENLERAAELVLAGRGEEVQSSPALQELLTPESYDTPRDEETSNIFSTVPLAGIEELDTDGLLPLADLAGSRPLPELDRDFDWTAAEGADPQASDAPQIGATELESLAQLFEQDDVDMDTAWGDMQDNDTEIILRMEASQTYSEEVQDLLTEMEELEPAIASIDNLDALLDEVDSRVSFDQGPADDLDAFLDTAEEQKAIGAETIPTDDLDSLDDVDSGIALAQVTTDDLTVEEHGADFAPIGTEIALSDDLDAFLDVVEEDSADLIDTATDSDPTGSSDAILTELAATDEASSDASLTATDVPEIAEVVPVLENLFSSEWEDDLFGTEELSDSLGLADPEAGLFVSAEVEAPEEDIFTELGSVAQPVTDFNLLDDVLDLQQDTVPERSEIDELSAFFGEVEEGAIAAEPLTDLNFNVEAQTPLADVPEIPDLTALEALVSVPDTTLVFAELEALVSDGLGEPTFQDLEALLEPATSDVETELLASLESALTSSPAPVAPKPQPAPAPLNLNKPAKSQPLKVNNVRVDVKYLDSLNNLVGELVVNRNLLGQDQERLQNFLRTLLDRVSQLSDVSQKMRDQYDRSLLESSVAVGRSRNQTFTALARGGISAIDVSDITQTFEDIEFDRYNTFHILSQEIIELIVKIKESASDIEFVITETEQVTRELGRIASQIQDDLKQSRMVPFSNLADRLPRGVRDRAVKSGKQAELVVIGGDTLIDKSILEQLTDPMTHLVNNAVDHGLEPPDERERLGKPRHGTIEVKAYHQGNQTMITVRDDGGGINPDKVKEKAVKKGLKTREEVERMSPNEVYELLFMPGFSTRDMADQFAGRGVGLDVVKSCLDNIKGSIYIESEVGKGTQFTIRLPLTLSISKAIFCVVDRVRLAIPIDGFEDMVELPRSQVVQNNLGQDCILWQDTLLPFQPLSELLQFNRKLSGLAARAGTPYAQDTDELCVIVLRDSENNFLGLQVDQFLGEYEIVVKQLEAPIPKPPGIAGATVLGDGRVISIVNVQELFDLKAGKLKMPEFKLEVPPQETTQESQPVVLVVDDSIVVREMLSATFSKVGYFVEVARDGQEAYEKLRGGFPADLIFCDIEMPRMDGMQLLAALQKDERLARIPVAMLTSRGADKHRQTAIQLGAKAYFTKPYLEEEVITASQRLLRGEVLVT
ncbi:MAG: response regulator [Pseudanabaenaceae cyanobacterium]